MTASSTNGTGSSLTKFVAAIGGGEAPPAGADELNALLHWLAGRNNADARAVGDAFAERGTSETGARRLAMLYLDSTLFADESDPYRLLGLTPGAGLKAIRARHKQLLQMFHPDRHGEDTAWFTRHAERINRAYAQLKSGQGKTPAEAESNKPKPAARAKPPRSAAPRASRHVTTAGLQRGLKHRLGNPEKLQKRVFAVLFAVPVLVLALVFFSNRGGVADQDLVIAAVNDAPGDAAKDPVSEQTGGKDTGLSRDQARELVSGQATEQATDESNNLSEGKPADVAKNEATDKATATAKTTATHADVTSSDVTGAEVTEADVAATALQKDPNAAAIAEAATDNVANNESSEPPVIVAAAIDRPTARSADQPTDPVQEIVRAARTDLQKPEQARDTHPTQSQDDTQRIPERQVEHAQTEAGATDIESPEPVVAIDEKDESDSRPQQAKEEGTPSADSEVARLAPHPEPKPRDDLQSVRELLERYQQAYNRGANYGFAALLHSDVQSGEGKDKAGVAQAYADYFASTSERALVLDNTRIRLLGRGQFRVRSNYTVAWRNRSGYQDDNSGNLELHLVPEDGRLRIWRLNISGSELKSAGQRTAQAAIIGTATDTTPARVSEPVSTKPTTDPSPSQVSTPESNHRAAGLDAPSGAADRSPNEHEDPTAPATTPTVKTAGAALPAQPAEPILPVRHFLNRYLDLYNRADLDAFTALFIDKARTTGADGKKAIRKQYRDFFRGVRQHQLTFNETSIEPGTRGTFKAQADFRLELTRANGSSDTIKGTLSFQLVHEGPELRIGRLTY